MRDKRHDGAMRSSIAAESVGDQADGRRSLILQQLAEKAPRRMSIATRLNQYIDHVSVLIDCAPQVILAAADPKPNQPSQRMKTPSAARGIL